MRKRVTVASAGVVVGEQDDRLDVGVGVADELRPKRLRRRAEIRRW